VTLWTVLYEECTTETLERILTGEGAAAVRKITTCMWTGILFAKYSLGHYLTLILLTWRIW